MNNLSVVKFGGTSLATGRSVKMVLDIVKNDKNKKIVVVSAPGRRFKEDVKITDMLFDVYDNKTSLNDVKKRFVLLIDEFLTEMKNEFGFFMLGIVKNKLLGELDKEFKIIEAEYRYKGIDYLVSRGEYLISKMLAVAFGYQFADAKDVVLFLEDGQVKINTDLLKSNLSKGVVVGGFYGASLNGEIKTFSRGGSDITGAYLARELSAYVYENYTDVDGVYSSDPSSRNAELIEKLTYDEMEKLNAVVFHPDAIYIMSKTGIPTVIKNTFNKNAKGTTIVSG